jgi:hypothetical protein
MYSQNRGDARRHWVSLGKFINREPAKGIYRRRDLVRVFLNRRREVPKQTA